LALGGLASLGVLVVAASTAWACVSGPVVNLSTIQAKPGETITLTGTGFRQPDPVHVRFNALDGPVIATLDKPASDRTIEGTVTVPATAAPGNYVLIVTQAGADGRLSQSPIRALLTVVGPSGQTPVVGADLGAGDEERLPGLVRSDDSVSNGTLALVALGVGGMGMFFAGIAALFASRRGATERPVPVKARR
jgi:hypothetical protein